MKAQQSLEKEMEEYWLHGHAYDPIRLGVLRDKIAGEFYTLSAKSHDLAINAHRSEGRRRITVARQEVHHIKTMSATAATKHANNDASAEVEAEHEAMGEFVGTKIVMEGLKVTWESVRQRISAARIEKQSQAT
jgi:hypothetical protein